MTGGRSSAELVIFDCDGVLVDSESLSQCVLVEMLSERGVSLSVDAALARFTGASDARSLELVGELLGGAPAAPFMDEYLQRAQRAFESRLTAIPGVEEALAALAMPYCVASNSALSRMHFKLARTGLLQRFHDRLYSAEQVASPKPAPDLFLLAARDQGVEPARCLVIEDSPAGVMAARAAGMRVYGFTALMPAIRLREAGAHALFAHMRELPRLMNEN